MVKIEVETHLDKFREFIILATCRSFIPDELYRDKDVFPERETGVGPIYVEAEDKVTVKKIGEISFVKAVNVLGVIYESKSGNTKLKWRQIRDKFGKLNGEASGNSLVNLITAGIINKSYVEKVLNIQKSSNENGSPNTDDTGSNKSK